MTAYIDFIGEMKIEVLKTNLEANLTSDQYEITKRSARCIKENNGQ